MSLETLQKIWTSTGNSYMSLLDKMDEEVECPETIFKEVIENKRQFDVFIFVEGIDDMNYYNPRLSMEICNKKYHSFNCENKNNVLIVHKMLNSKSIDLTNKVTLFFVDRDFDNDITYPDDIFVTPCYAIENFYFTNEAFEKILSNFFHIDSLKNEDSNDFFNAMKFLTSKREQYIQEMLYANAFYSLQIRKKNKSKKQIVDLKKLKDFKNIRGVKSLTELENMTPNFFSITQNEITTEIAFLNTKPVQLLRGKYFEQAMTDDFRKLIEFSNNKSNQGGIFTKRRKISTQLGKDNFIAVFASFADTPSELKEYLIKKFSCLGVA